MNEGEAMERDDGHATGRRRLVRGLGVAVLAIGLVALGVAAGIWGERRASTGGAQRAGSATGSAATHGGMAMPASPPRCVGWPKDHRKVQRSEGPQR